VDERRDVRNFEEWAESLLADVPEVEVEERYRLGVGTHGPKPTGSYPYAWNYVIRQHNDAGATDVRLVHGYCGADGREGIRAWALIGEGVVYDPIERRFYDKDAYYRALEVESQTVYTPQDAARLLRERDDFGPWSAPSPIGE
jgi:hypothetical protein